MRWNCVLMHRYAVWPGKAGACSHCWERLITAGVEKLHANRLAKEYVTLWESTSTHCILDNVHCIETLDYRREQALALSLSVMSRKLGYTHGVQLLCFDWLVSVWPTRQKSPYRCHESSIPAGNDEKRKRIDKGQPETGLASPISPVSPTGNGLDGVAVCTSAVLFAAHGCSRSGGRRERGVKGFGFNQTGPRRLRCYCRLGLDEIGLPSDRYSVSFTGHNKVTARLFLVFMSNWGAVYGIDFISKLPNFPQIALPGESLAAAEAGLFKVVCLLKSGTGAARCQHRGKCPSMTKSHVRHIRCKGTEAD
ncbi:hypothetical protein B0T20DRAFT_470759, partial [Sordaria brevicollis]